MTGEQNQEQLRRYLMLEDQAILSGNQVDLSELFAQLSRLSHNPEILLVSDDSFLRIMNRYGVYDGISHPARLYFMIQNAFVASPPWIRAYRKVVIKCCNIHMKPRQRIPEFNLIQDHPHALYMSEYLQYAHLCHSVLDNIK